MKIICVLAFFLCGMFHTQNIGFQLNEGARKEVIPFQLINNLIFIPVTLNGVELTFLLDTGVSETMMLSQDNKQVDFSNLEKMRFSGLGENIDIEGLKSIHNKLSAGKAFADSDHTVFIILNEEFNFSSHIGIPVHGIVGFHFFRNNPVEIDYISKKITIYPAIQNTSRKLRGYEAFPIMMDYNKPHLIADVELTNQSNPSKLLIDLGNSDAIWLFPSLIKDFVYNRPNIDDYLGQGFNGEIHGKRSRIHRFSIGSFSFEKPPTAMPDEYSIQNLRMARDRKGSVGGEILRRFKVVFDYPNGKIYLKKNSNFNEPFYFNMSGLDFKHDGTIWQNEMVKVENPIRQSSPDKGTTVINNSFQYKLVMRPLFAVAGVRKDSPAYHAGMRKGDVLVNVNGRKASEMTLFELNKAVSTNEGKAMQFRVTRNSETLDFKFKLEDPIPYQEN